MERQVLDKFLFYKVEPIEVSEYFNNIIIKSYPSFKFKYSWNKSPEVLLFLQRLFLTSFFNSRKIAKELPNIILEVEDFFYKGFKSGIFNEKNIITILSRIDNIETGCQMIEYIPAKLTNNIIIHTSNRLQLNEFTSLVDSKVRKAYLFNEFCKIVIGINNNRDVIRNYISTISCAVKSKGIKKADTTNRNQVYNGFLLIEDILSNELTEKLCGYSMYKCYSKKSDVTEYDYYQLIRELIVKFCISIRGCAYKTNDDKEILLNLINRSMDTNLVNNIISEYYNKSDGSYYDLFKILRGMGLIKSNNSNELNIKFDKVYNAISLLCDKNKDGRKALEHFYPDVDFKMFGYTSSVGRR